MREYADVLMAVSDVIELIEEPRMKPGAIENAYSFEVNSETEFAIPEGVKNEIGAVEHIDVTLSLATDVVSSDEDFDRTYDEEPSLEVFLDKINKPAETIFEKRIAKNANISVYLHGASGAYVIDRSSLNPTHTTPDHVLRYVNGRLAGREVSPVSQVEFNQLILSIVSPDYLQSTDGNAPIYETDFLKPSSFDALAQLFQGVTFADTSYIGHQFRTSDTFFQYHTAANPLTDQLTTAYKIRFSSNEAAHETILVRSDIDTGFKLSFATVVTYDWGKEPTSEEATSTAPYTPTLSELQHLRKLFNEEARALKREIRRPIPAFEVYDRLANPHDLIAETDHTVAIDQDFRTIAARAIDEAFLDIVDPLGDE